MLAEQRAVGMSCRSNLLQMPKVFSVRSMDAGPYATKNPVKTKAVVEGFWLSAHSRHSRHYSILVNRALCGHSLQFALMNGVRTFLPLTYSSDRLIVLNDHGLKVLFASHHRMMTFPMLIFHVPNIARTDIPGFTIASGNSDST